MAPIIWERKGFRSECGHQHMSLAEEREWARLHGAGDAVLRGFRLAVHHEARRLHPARRRPDPIPDPKGQMTKKPEKIFQNNTTIRITVMT